MVQVRWPYLIGFDVLQRGARDEVSRLLATQVANFKPKLDARQTRKIILYKKYGNGAVCAIAILRLNNGNTVRFCMSGLSLWGK